jgi:hypothetical protein
MLRKAGYPIVLIQRMGIETNSHQCGTIRFGTDPTKSVVDPFAEATTPNLFVVDSSFFPSSAAVNPALTMLPTHSESPITSKAAFRHPLARKDHAKSRATSHCGLEVLKAISLVYVSIQDYTVREDRRTDRR